MAKLINLTGQKFDKLTVIEKLHQGKDMFIGNVCVTVGEINKWAAAHNIPLVRIPYWERDNITLEMLLGDKYLVKV